MSAVDTVIERYRLQAVGCVPLQQDSRTVFGRWVGPPKPDCRPCTEVAAAEISAERGRFYPGSQITRELAIVVGMGIRA